MNRLIPLSLALVLGLVGCAPAKTGDDPDEEGSVDKSSDDTGISEGDDTGVDSGSAGTDADGDGFFAEGDDCDDSDADIHPDADELCDEVDHNCDGDPVAGAVDAQLGWTDSDGDGYGDPDSPVEACELPSGVVDNDGDCNDSAAQVNPDGFEECDGELDEDCDGLVDEDDPDTDSCSTDWDGTYTGSVAITVSEASTGLSDTCSGTGTAWVDDTVSPAIQAELSCAFTGALSSIVPGTQTGTIDGEFDGPNTASGEIAISSIVSDTWTGTFSTPGRLVATISGTTTYSGYTITYSGTFDGNR